MYNILVATVKPFAPAAVKQIREEFEKPGYECFFFEKYNSQEELIEAVKKANALIVRSDKITREVINAAENLKIVVRAGAGYDNIDLKASSDKGIVVMNTPGQNSNAVAELALGMMVFQARNHFNGTSGRELKGKKLGIHAYGHVGQQVARIANGFGMEIYAFDPFIPGELMKKDGVNICKSAEEMYAMCDYISLHIPANEKTKNSINHNLLSTMKEGAVLVNTARKEVIDEAGLEKMFEENPGFQYVADIAPGNAGLLQEKYKDRCFFTPKKMGAQTAEANINAGIAAARQIINYFESNDTTFVVN